MEHSIGKFILELRKQKGMTQKELAEKLFVSDKTVSRWESDKCTPDLNLIPVIADIFEVSVEELLRGERVHAPSVLENEPDFSTAKPIFFNSSYSDVKTDDEKQQKYFKRILNKNLTKFKNLSLLSVGIFIAGIFAAFICNFAFFRSTLGFCLAAVFTIAAIICQICFTNSFLLRTEDEETPSDIISAYNSDILKITIKFFILIIGAFGLPLPFVLTPTLSGLTFESWIGLAVLFCIVLFLLSIFLYKTFIERIFVNKGLIILSEREKIKNRARKEIFKKAGIPCGGVALLLVLGVIVVTSVLSVYSFFKPIEFSNYEAFQNFMAKDVTSDFYVDTDVNIVYPDDNKYSEEETPTTYYLFNASDEIICEYIWNNKDVYRVEVNQEESDGLPIRVYTYRDKYNGYDTQATIKNILITALAADCILFIILYAIKISKA